MKRIIMHWSAGAHRASKEDRAHYHLMIEGGGNVVYGDKPISANAAPLSKDYAAHTAKLNTDSIGVAVCAMHGVEGLVALEVVGVGAGLTADVRGQRHLTDAGQRRQQQCGISFHQLGVTLKW